MKTTVCLVRHGETEWNAQGRLQGREDVDLTVKGVEQAVAVSDYLGRIGSWNVMMSSPLLRAKRTAEIIATGTQTSEFIVMEDLIERDLGIASGMRRDELAERFPDGHITGQEPLDDVKARMMRSLQYAVHRFPGTGVVMVSHGAAINALLSLLSDGEIGTGKTILKNTCLNMISFMEGKWSIDLHNATPHLK